eukprot:CAMPEP_0197034784 /NCGR_PEP_ID=MMETSP1384-20130603/12764_1 /TAXON_ID=29189 /ORGANISM="Ammonia sp." /LENGTH=309 /DNA_ID=CAMNT_0042464739 /DNA_START=10 /DNA_END=939 /DNA_ORIENTATION=-
MSSKKRSRDASANNSSNSPSRKRHKRNIPDEDEELMVNVMELQNNLSGMFTNIEMTEKMNNLHELITEWNDLMRPNDINDIDVANLEEADFCLMHQITDVAFEALQQSKLALLCSTKCTDFFFEKLRQQKIAKKRQLEKEQQAKQREQIQYRRSLTISKDIWSPIERVNYFREGFQAAIKTEITSSDHVSNIVTTQSHYIVCKIVAVNRSKQECTLIDVANAASKYTRSFSNIMPLPSINIVSLSKRTVFKAGTKVLAVYPATTCFYAATIVKPPKSNQSQQTKYTLRFDDDGDNEKDIESERVMPYVT